MKLDDEIVNAFTPLEEYPEAKKAEQAAFLASKASTTNSALMRCIPLAIYGRDMEFYFY